MRPAVLILALALIAVGADAASAATLDYGHHTAMLIDGAPGDRAGASVAPAGDVNGDGIPDILVGAPGWPGPGAAYVVYGRRGPWPVRVRLDRLTADDGYRISGAARGDLTGGSVAPLDDVNGDGVPEALIGAWGADTHGKDSGAAYVVFGRRGPAAGPVDLARLSASDGYRIDGPRKEAYAGWSVGSAGDVDGDGVDDLLIGATGWMLDTRPATYVVFGRRSSASAIHLSTLPSPQGYPIRDTGDTVAPAGDVSGDGVPDALVGGGRGFSASAFVIFGQRTASPAAVDPRHLKATEGYLVQGAGLGVEYGGGTWEGAEVHPIGDMNGDGVPDLLTVGGGDPYDARSGAFVVYGQRTTQPATIHLPGIPLSAGYGMVDIPGGLQETTSNMAPAGDVNHDGLPDVLVGGNASLSVVYGRRAPLVSERTIDVGRLIPSQGYRFRGFFGGDSLETSGQLAGGGDITGDGVPDALLGGSLEAVDRRGAGRVRVLALRAMAPAWPRIKLNVVGPSLPGGCAARSLRLTADTVAPPGAPITVRIRLDGRTLVRTSGPGARTLLRTTTLRPARHRVTATATTSDGTQATDTARFKVCRTR